MFEEATTYDAVKTKPIKNQQTPSIHRIVIGQNEGSDSIVIYQRININFRCEWILPAFNLLHQYPEDVAQ